MFLIFLLLHAMISNYSVVPGLLFGPFPASSTLLSLFLLGSHHKWGLVLKLPR